MPALPAVLLLAPISDDNTTNITLFPRHTKGGWHTKRRRQLLHFRHWRSNEWCALRADVCHSACDHGPWRQAGFGVLLVQRPAVAACLFRLGSGDGDVASVHFSSSICERVEVVRVGGRLEGCHGHHIARHVNQVLGQRHAILCAQSLKCGGGLFNGALAALVGLFTALLPRDL